MRSQGNGGQELILNPLHLNITWSLQDWHADLYEDMPIMALCSECLSYIESLKKRFLISLHDQHYAHIWCGSIVPDSDWTTV